LPIIEAIENIAAPTIEHPLPTEALSDAIAKPKSTKRSAKSKAKYTRDELEAIALKDLRKMVTQVPREQRAGFIQKNMTKVECIDVILKAKT
jgi:hypothetical protein